MAEKNLPLYKLIITDDPELGINAMALVNDPAISVDWIAFSEQNICQFKTVDEAQRIISGPFLIPDILIYRFDEKHGKHFVTIDAPMIKNVALRFFKEGNTSNVNLMHNDNIQPSDIYMFESFLIDSKHGINTPIGFDALPDGTWFGSYKVDNPVVWDKYIKTGIFKGFSVEGLLGYEKTKTKEQVEMEEIISELEGLIRQ
jgi:hypothetical protein